MEVVANTEYQEIYRVTGGVLLIINKFTRKYPDKNLWMYNCKTGRYKKECQQWLRVLKEDYYDKHSDITIPMGTILYYDQPVQVSTNEVDWEYQIKTTGEAFSGNKKLIKSWLGDILYKIKT